MEGLQIIGEYIKFIWTMIMSTLNVYFAIDSVKIEILSTIFGVSTTIVSFIAFAILIIKMIKRLR